MLLALTAGGTADADATESPAAVLAGVELDGYSPEADPPIPTRDLTYGDIVDYAGAEPEFDPPLAETADYRGAVRYFHGAAGDVVSISAATSGDSASVGSIATGAVEAARRSGLELTPPFAGARSFQGSTDGIDTTTIVWTQGVFTIIVDQLRVGAAQTLDADTIAQRVASDVRRQTGESPAVASTQPDRGIAYRIGYALGPLLFAPFIALPILWYRRRRRTGSDDPSSLPPPPSWPAPTQQSVG
jgi:hypothetical protein